VVETAAPGDGDVGLFVADLTGCVERAAARHGAVVVETVEEGTVAAAEVESDFFLVRVVLVPGLVLGRGGAKIVEVVAGVKRFELLVCGGAGVVVIHGKGHAIGRDERFGESQTPRLHGMGLAKVMFLHLWVGVVGDGGALWCDDVVLLRRALHLVEEDGVFPVGCLVHVHVVRLHDGLVRIDAMGEIVRLGRLVSVGVGTRHIHFILFGQVTVGACSFPLRGAKLRTYVVPYFLFFQPLRE